MKLFIINIGCKVNYAESSRLGEILSNQGFTLCKSLAEAEVILINTCTVTNKADSDCRATIRKARRQAPDAFIGVFGCYAQLNSEDISKMPEVNAIYGSKEKFLIPELLPQQLQSRNVSVNVSDLCDLQFDIAFTNDSGSRTRAFLKIQDGCNYFCSYCTIPHARGHARSFDFDLLPDVFKKLRDSNYKEVVLSGINLGEYSHNSKKFIDVLELIANNDFGMRFRISSIEPNLINDKLIELMSFSDNICNHFHIPLQSGSDYILKLMRRRYNTRTFIENIEKIHQTNDNSCIGLDVISGFPSESDNYFDETYNLISKLPISYIHSFTYSERKGTDAADMPNQIAMKIRKERTSALRKLSDEKMSVFIDSQIGKIGNVLPETYNAKELFFVGHTQNYIKCRVFDSSKPTNNFISVQYKSHSNGIADCIKV